MECHFKAVDADGNPSDFVYFLGRVGSVDE
jgi:hypothetical protein